MRSAAASPRPTSLSLATARCRVRRPTCAGLCAATAAAAAAKGRRNRERGGRPAGGGLTVPGRRRTRARAHTHAAPRAKAGGRRGGKAPSVSARVRASGAAGGHAVCLCVCVRARRRAFSMVPRELRGARVRGRWRRGGVCVGGGGRRAFSKVSMSVMCTQPPPPQPSPIIAQFLSISHLPAQPPAPPQPRFPPHTHTGARTARVSARRRRQALGARLRWRAFARRRGSRVGRVGRSRAQGGAGTGEGTDTGGD